MHYSVKEFIESLHREIDRAEEQACFWESPEVLRVENITGRKLNKEELAAKYRKDDRRVIEADQSIPIQPSEKVDPVALHAMQEVDGLTR